MCSWSQGFLSSFNALYCVKSALLLYKQVFWYVDGSLQARAIQSGEVHVVNVA